VEEAEGYGYDEEGGVGMGAHGLLVPDAGNDTEHTEGDAKYIEEGGAATA
jgi:hypothetical protein